MMRPVRNAAILAFLLFAAACSSSSGVRFEVPATAWVSQQEPLVSLAVFQGADKRPLNERGQRKVLSTSWLEDAALQEPTAVRALAVLRADLARSGVTAQVLADSLEAAYSLEVTLHHLAASWSTGVESLALFLPALRTEAFCELGFTLRDRHGRIFFEETRRAALVRHVAPLEQPSAGAAVLLGKAVRQCLDEALPRLIPAVDSWWRARGLAPRREAALSPLPVPRSSTDR